jgi:tol-pal system protein YbgF
MGAWGIDMKKAVVLLALLMMASPGYGARTDRMRDDGYMYARMNELERRLDKLESKVKKLSKGAQPPRETIIEVADVLPPADDVEENIVIQADVEAPEATAGVKMADGAELRFDSRVAEREFYDDAFSALRENRVSRAEKLFLEFVNKFPNGSLVSNAHFWLGEIYYAQRKYKDASFYFLSSYQSGPKGSKAPESVLKLAMSLEHLDNISGACSTLIKLVNDFPQMHHEIKRQAHIELSKLRCDNN